MEGNTQPEVSTEYCSNCKREIPGINFVMHVNHCKRNITLCKICNEPIPTSQQEEHFEENHAKVKCECGMWVEKMNIEDHKVTDCSKRIVTCEYCELELAFKDMSSHKEYCGSRTELCEKCNKYIQKRDLLNHLESDCDYFPTLPNNAATTTNLQNGYGRHNPPEILKNFGESEEFGVGREALRSILSTGLGTLPVAYPMRDEASLRNSRTLPMNMGCQDNGVVARGPVGYDFPGSVYQRIADNEYEDYVDVEDGQFESDQLMAAMLASRLQHMEDNATDGAFGGFRDPLPGITPTNDEDDTIAPGLNGTALPCEFCDGLFPAADLIQHQSGCQLTSAEEHSSSPLRYPNLRSVPQSLPPMVNDSNQQDEIYLNEKEQIDTHTDGNADDTFLPCEFCQELFPLDALIVHQSVCDPHGSRPPSTYPNEVHDVIDPDPVLAFPNKSLRRRSNRPARTSRPVVSDDREDWTPHGWAFDAGNPESDDNSRINEIRSIRREPDTSNELESKNKLEGRVFEYGDRSGLNNSSPFTGLGQEASTQTSLQAVISVKSNRSKAARTKTEATTKGTSNRSTSGRDKNALSRPKLEKKMNYSNEKIPISTTQKAERSDKTHRRGPRAEASSFSLDNTFHTDVSTRAVGAGMPKSGGRPKSDLATSSRPRGARPSGLARNGAQSEHAGLYAVGTAATSQEPFKRERSGEGSRKDIGRADRGQAARASRGEVTRPTQNRVTSSGTKKSASRKKIV